MRKRPVSRGGEHADDRRPDDTAAADATPGVVEHGTSKMPARPYAGPAAERARGRFPDRVADRVRERIT